MTNFDNPKKGEEQELQGKKGPEYELENQTEPESTPKRKRTKKKQDEHVPRSIVYKKDMMHYYGCCSKTATIKMADLRTKLNLEPKSHINVIHLAKAESCTEEEIRRMLRIM